uniref:G_PROTEIN_RECEP_F1_2 domain-containing protein n=1 Tax=Panagrellus redivivus TaxID=6233 RepID=A0A7E4VNA8_PANRE
MYAKDRCAAFIKAFYLKAIIINVTFGLLAMLLAVIGIKRLKPIESTTTNVKKSLERRFLDQTLTGAILIVLYYSAYVYFLIEDATDETYVIVDTFVTIFYIIQHFAPMFMLFFI